MEKQKTALCLAIEQIKELQSNEEVGSFTKRAYAVCMDVLESLKPTEREIINNSYNEGYRDGETSIPDQSKDISRFSNAQDYFDTNLTQE